MHSVTNRETDGRHHANSRSRSYYAAVRSANLKTNALPFMPASYMSLKNGVWRLSTAKLRLTLDITPSVFQRYSFVIKLQKPRRVLREHIG